MIISVCSCSVKVAAGAVVCVESEIRGDVTIGESFDFTINAILTYIFKKRSPVR